MQQFRIGEEGFKKLRKRMLNIFVPCMVIVVLAFVLVNVLGPKTERGDTWWYIVPIFPIIYGVSMYRGIKKQKKFLQSYCVTISDNDIMREQMNTPPLTINFMEIKEIIKSEKGHFTIKGSGSKDIIHIPSWINNPVELEQCLETFTPIKARTKDPWHMKLRWVPAALGLLMFAALYLMDNKPIVATCGILLSGLIIWAIYYILTSKNIPTSSKKRIWIYFIILFSVLYLAYTKFTGNLLFH